MPEVTRDDYNRLSLEQNQAKVGKGFNGNGLFASERIGKDAMVM